jgi:hypothetical protein
MPAQALTTITAAPVRNSPGTFSDRHDKLVTSLVALLAGLNTRKSYLEGLSSTATPAWVSGASYTAGDAVYSTSTWKTYRAKTTHSGESTDPSSDTTNWKLASGVVAADQAKLDNITVTAAVDLDVAAAGFYATADGSITAGEVVVLKTATGKVAAVTASPSDADDWLGLAESSVSDGETVGVTLKGGINTSQSGLTAGSIYYVDDDGSLTITDTGRKIGRALSATSILVTEGNA